MVHVPAPKIYSMGHLIQHTCTKQIYSEHVLHFLCVGLRATLPSANVTSSEHVSFMSK